MQIAPLSGSKNTPLKFSQLSQEGQLRLFDLAFHSLVFGISSIPLCAAAFSIWAYFLHLNLPGLWIWGVVYLIAALAIHFLHRAYQRDRKSECYEHTFPKWLLLIKGVAFLHGLGLTIPFFILIGTAPFEFRLLYLITVAAIIAAFATHLTPIVIAFLYLFIPCWGVCLVLMPWVFPDQWAILLFLALIYAASMVRHALLGHQFFLKQILLEDEGTKLAENYKIAKVQAEVALQAKNQFLTTASHDLRQPVHAMGFLIESILRRNKDVAIQPALNDLKQSVHSVTQMFNSLLDLSKIESGNVALHTSSIDLDNLIQEITTTFSEEAHTKNLKIRVHLSKGRAIVSADHTLLHQSIMNLMHNALRYTKHGGVLVAVRKRGDVWQLDVWDTGIGIAQQDQAHIYSPFFRNEHAWKIDSAGHGLGLAVVARCCQMMGCQYGYSSRLNRGSHFWLRLPASITALQAMPLVNVAKPQVEAQQAHAQLSGTCLIVDDDPQVIAAWELLLSAWGVTAKCVDSGKQALMALEDGFVPQVIFCDQRLRAGENGFEVLQALLARNPNAHGAMISGEFNSPELQQAESEGYLVLHKPLEPEQLLTILSRWLNAQ